MTWPKVLVLAAALLLGLVLHGGVYEVATFRDFPMRTNRLTGRVEVFYAAQNAERGWRVLEGEVRSP